MNPRHVLVLALVAISAPVVSCNLAALLSGVLAPNNNLTLMDLAEQLVAPSYPNAILIEAPGAVASGSGNTAADVTRWQFRFTEDPAAPGAGTVWVDYEDGKLSGPFYTTQGLIGTEFVRIPRTMSLEEAILKMRAAGFADLFTSVVVRRPLTFPPPTETLYIFSLPGQFILVGMTTGAVTTEQTLANPPTFLQP